MKFWMTFPRGGKLAALFDISLYRSDPTRSRGLAHYAIGSARQAGLLRLELLCWQLETALEKGEFVTAESLGRDLPAVVALARTELRPSLRFEAKTMSRFAERFRAEGI